MGASSGLPVGLDDDHDVERLAELLVQGLGLVNAGFDLARGCRFLEALVRQMRIVQLGAIFAVRSMPLIGAVIR
jgi:hypothetical protein